MFSKRPLQQLFFFDSGGVGFIPSVQQQQQPEPGGGGGGSRGTVLQQRMLRRRRRFCRKRAIVGEQLENLGVFTRRKQQ